jgi:hypothetical protein
MQVRLRVTGFDHGNYRICGIVLIAIAGCEADRGALPGRVASRVVVWCDQNVPVPVAARNIRAPLQDEKYVVFSRSPSSHGCEPHGVARHRKTGTIAAKGINSRHSAGEANRIIIKHQILMAS